MVKIYPESIPKKNDDVMYDLMCNVICALIFCVFIFVGLIVVITLAIEKDNNDGSY